MTKDEIRQEIKEARKRHNAELKALEAKLNEPEKWKPKLNGHLTIEEERERIKHINRQDMLWRLANDLNKGWKPDWDDINQMKFRPFYDHSMNRWDWVYNTQGNSQIPSFKDTQTARKACEILNNQPELMQ